MADLSGAAPLVGDADLTGTLTINGWYNVVPQSAVEGFQELYPNVKFEFVDLGVPDTHTKLLTGLTAGAGAPDISFVADRDGPRFFDQPLVDLTECLAPYEATFPAYKWQKIVRPDGSLQAVPWESGPMSLVYRTDVFEQYGIDASSIATWDDYIAAGKELVAASNGAVHMLMSNLAENPGGLQSSITADFQALTQQNGGQFFDSAGNVVVSNREAEEALAMLLRFRTEGITLNDLASPQAEIEGLANGTVATYLAPAWWNAFPEAYAPETIGKWGAIKLPAFEDGGARSSNRGGTSLVITEQSDAKEAAWAFLKYWLLRVDSRVTNFEVGKIFEAIFIPAQADPIFHSGNPTFGGFQWTELSIAAAAEAPVFIEGRAGVPLDNEFQSRLPALLEGTLSPSDALAQVQEAVNSQR